MIYNGYNPFTGDVLETKTDPVVIREAIVIGIVEKEHYCYIDIAYKFNSEKYPACYQNDKYMTLTLRSLSKEQIKGMEKGDVIAVQFWIMASKYSSNICQLYNWYSVKKNLIK